MNHNLHVFTLQTSVQSHDRSFTKVRKCLFVRERAKEREREERERERKRERERGEREGRKREERERVFP